MHILRRLLNCLRARPDEFESSLRPTSEIAARCNGFLRAFCDSDLDSIKIEDAAFNTDANPVLKHLRGGSYREIRNRLRILSNLDPVVNRTEESGRIHLSYATDDADGDNAPFRDAELRTVFPVDQTGFFIHKIKIDPAYAPAERR